MKRSLRAAVLAAALIGCAGEELAPPPAPDPIVIPETAVAVQTIALAHNNAWTPLNQRMLLARAGTRDYLLTFNEPCPPLRDPSALIFLQTYGDHALYANSDSISVGTKRCRIGDIYSILREDAVSLRNRAKRP